MGLTKLEQRKEGMDEERRTGRKGEDERREGITRQTVIN
jgi:hypothetical protein